MNEKVEVYDTTLRDGCQAEGVGFSIVDEIQIALKLDWLGVGYIEGGWPYSNEKDVQFFREIRKRKLKHAKIAAFGSTMHPKNTAATDPNLRALIESKPDVFTIFGKSWDLHCTDALRISLDENLKVVGDSVRFLKRKAPVIFDAEHFFDGYKSNPEFALRVLEAAANAGAETLVLCETNGGSLPKDVYEITAAAVKRLPGMKIGIHTHNDAGCAVANTIAGVQAGASHVQGTINGIGERTGNADLIVAVANLQLKLRKQCLSKNRIASLTEVSRYVYEIMNAIPPNNQPFVGLSAFAHKGGIHVSAVKRNPRCYEHVPPESVGNVQRIIISEQSGGSNLEAKAAAFKIDIDKKDPVARKVLAEVVRLENQGYQFELAEASFEMLFRRIKGIAKEFFTLDTYQTMVRREGDGHTICEAIVKGRVGKRAFLEVADGHGPVNALDDALRKALEPEYPKLKKLHLIDYKVRIVHAELGTAAVPRVIIEWRVGDRIFNTIGVHENIIEASLAAVIDGILYHLHSDDAKGRNG